MKNLIFLLIIQQTLSLSLRLSNYFIKNVLSIQNIYDMMLALMVYYHYFLFYGGIILEKLVITGKTPLKGEVIISGAKNAAVAILPATLLINGICTKCSRKEERVC